MDSSGSAMRFKNGPSRDFLSEPGSIKGMPIGEAKEDERPPALILRRPSGIVLEDITTHKASSLVVLTHAFEFMWSDVDMGTTRDYMSYMVFAINFMHKAAASFLFGYFTYTYKSVAQVCLYIVGHGHIHHTQMHRQL